MNDLVYIDLDNVLNHHPTTTIYINYFMISSKCWRWLFSFCAIEFSTCSISIWLLVEVIYKISIKLHEGGGGCHMVSRKYRKTFLRNCWVPEFIKTSCRFLKSNSHKSSANSALVIHKFLILEIRWEVWSV